MRLTLLAVAVLALLIACSSHGAEATNPVTYDSFYLYAVSADNWVRNDVRYNPSRLRAADGISKADATKFTAITQNGPPSGTPLSTFSIISLKSLVGAHPWCLPGTANPALINGTIYCQNDSQTSEWLYIYRKNDATIGAPLYPGDTVRFAALGGGSCYAPPWPTNTASIYCANTGTDDWLDFHIEV